MLLIPFFDEHKLILYNFIFLPINSRIRINRPFLSETGGCLSVCDPCTPELSADSSKFELVPYHCLAKDKRAFSNEVCLSGREVMLRIVKLLRSEVSADVSSTLNFTLYEVQHFTAALPQLHFARSAKLH